MSILRASISRSRWCTGVVVAIVSSFLLVVPASATPSEIIIQADSTLRAGDRNTNEGINPLLFIVGSSGSRIVLDFGVKSGSSVGAASLLLDIVENGGNWLAGAGGQLGKDVTV